jgi:hypothetical protein
MLDVNFWALQKSANAENRLHIKAVLLPGKKYHDTHKIIKKS